MHFREQGKVLQLIRTTYDPVRKRGVQSVIGKMPRFTYAVPLEVSVLLTMEEKTQLADYLNALKAGREDESKASSLLICSRTIAAAASALTLGIKPKDADAIWSALADLSKALKKGGYRKPVPLKKVVVVTK